MGLKRDLNEIRYNSILRLPKQSNAEYWFVLFRNTRNFFIGLSRYDLLEKLNFIIEEKIEKIMHSPISNVLHTYKNLPYLNSFTRSRNPLYREMNIYKYTIKEWLESIEAWIFEMVITLEGQIRFTTPAQQIAFN